MILLSVLLNTVLWRDRSRRIVSWMLLSLTYKVLTTTQPSCLHNLVTVQPRSTRSSSLVTLARPSTSSSLRIADRSFQYASYQLLASLHQPCTNLSNSALPNSLSGTNSIGSIDSPLVIHHTFTLIPGLKLSFSATPSHHRLHSLPFLLPDWLHEFTNCSPILLSMSVFSFSVFLLSTF